MRLEFFDFLALQPQKVGAQFSQMRLYWYTLYIIHSSQGNEKRNAAVQSIFSVLQSSILLTKTTARKSSILYISEIEVNLPSTY